MRLDTQLDSRDPPGRACARPAPRRRRSRSRSRAARSRSATRRRSPTSSTPSASAVTASALAENKLNLEDVAGHAQGGQARAGDRRRARPTRACSSRWPRIGSSRSCRRRTRRTRSRSPPRSSACSSSGSTPARRTTRPRTPSPPSPIELGALPPGVQPIVAVDMTADGARVAAGRANVVQVYDVDSGLEIISLGGHKDIIQSLRFSPDGRRLAAGSYQIVTALERPDRRPQGDLRRPRRSGQGARRPARRLGRRLGRPRQDRPGLGRGRQTDPPVRHARARCSRWPSRPTARRLAVGGSDNLVRVVDAADGKERFALKGHTGPVVGVAFLPRRPPGRLGLGRRDRTRLDDPRRRRGDKPADPIVLDGRQGPAPRRRRHARRPDRRHRGRRRRGPALGRRRRQARPRRSPAHAGPVLALAVSPEGDRLLAGSADKTARLFDVAERHARPDADRAPRAGQRGRLQPRRRPTGDGGGRGGRQGLGGGRAGRA